MATFRVGEIAVIQAHPQCAAWWNENDGVEVEVVGFGHIPGYSDYEIKLPFAAPWGDGQCFTTEATLRKRRPPEEPGSWEEIERLTHWNPTRVSA